MKSKSKPKSIKGVKAFGILNADGQFWTTKTFMTEAAAENYMIVFWAGIYPVPDMSKHEVIPVLITPTIKRRK